MKQILIDIIDDSGTDINNISKIIKLNHPVLKLNTVFNGKTVSKAQILKKKPKVVFVSFSKKNNIELINELINEEILIIVLVNNNYQVLEAFKYDALFCMKSPVEFHELHEALNKIFLKLIILNQ
jgi:DNA-binding NarL/FixJ family response regulator